ncbi:MAG: alpha-glucan family phosphorylase [Lentisphaerae bacterium]|nr:alpha-glucan family phosphorylase [Lentisphaerota bacterium]
MSNRVQLFNVAPSFPDQLSFLEILSCNMWWSWNLEAIELFRRIDPKLWTVSGHNPSVFFSRIPQARLEALVDDDGFMSHYDQIREQFEAEGIGDTAGRDKVIAYFSLEYGVHESLRFYSGGLGCLAGDHLKSVSDMRVNMVAVGLLYRDGYFQQYLNEDGWQQEAYVENELHKLPIRRARDGSGKPVQVSVKMPEGTLYADVWQLDIGKVPLFLLNANTMENSPIYREIGSQLYTADRTIRLRQELLLGIGGFRALIQLGYDPSICHMNEGHAAFVSLARIEHLMKTRNVNLDVAEEIVRRTNIFTTHTPVPAGNETFTVDLVKTHLSVLEEELGVPVETALSWGKWPNKDHQHELTMTILALRMAGCANGVSKLHGRVTRNMWRNLWPNRPEDEIPICHITNGIHVASWLSADNAALLDKYLGPEWRYNPSDKTLLNRIDTIPDEELWRAHELGRNRLVRSAREYGEKQMAARSATRAEISHIKSVLNHDVLTIGFARRFASYKRATLLLSNPDRLEALLTNEEHPVQIVFAGKAHPADDIGKNFIREIVHFAHHANVRQKVIFIENYDIQIARYMVQGADVWLNNPRRPQEASGTSGMKAAINGALHVSVLDGWWDEAYGAEVGWAIGGREEYINVEYQDEVESQALYNLLENEVIPCFYDRENGDTPRRWIEMMKASMQVALEYFTSYRMVSEYNRNFYQPMIQEAGSLIENDCEKARKLVARRQRLQTHWHSVHIAQPQTDRDISTLHVGDKFRVTVNATLGELRVDEVNIEVYYGPVTAVNDISESHVKPMEMIDDQGDGKFVFAQEVQCVQTGRYGLTARVTPTGEDWKSLIPGFLKWADGAE